jgi:hypothetical protein
MAHEPRRQPAVITVALCREFQCCAPMTAERCAGAVFSLQIPNLQEPPGVVGEQNASTNSNPLFLLVHAR